MLARTREPHERLTFPDISAVSSVTGVRLGEWESLALLSMWQELVSPSTPALPEFSLAVFDDLFGVKNKSG